jgi:repressor LexA
MIGAHIVDGDIVILEDTKEVHDGDIVAALIDGETSLKRYVVERGRPYLKAENPRYPDLVPARELKIQGVMVSLIRKQERRKRIERVIRTKSRNPQLFRGRSLVHMKYVHLNIS